MRELLGEKDNHRLKLIELIYFEPNIRLEKLSKCFFLTPIQLQIDIGFINTFVHPLQIRVNKNKECSLEIPERYSIKCVYRDFLKNNLHFQILESILFSTYEKYDLLAEKLHISLATLKRKIQFINHHLKKHEMKIVSRPTRLVGHEANIRAFYNFYFKERFPDDEWNLNRAVDFFSKDLVNFFQKEFNFQVENYAALKRIERYVSISLMYEIVQGTIVVSKKEEHNKELLPQLEEIVALYPNKFNFEYTFDLDFSPSLFKKLFYHYLNQVQCGKKLISAESSDNQGLRDSVEEIIISLEKLFDATIQEKSKLLETLYQLLSVGKTITISPYIIVPSRKMFFLSNNPLREKVLNTTSVLFEQYLPEFSRRNHAYFYEFIYLLIIHWPKFYQLIFEKVTPCKVAILFNTDIEHAEYIKDQLSDSLEKKIEIKVIDVKTLDELKERSREYDFYLVNFILPKQVTTNIPVITMADTLSQDKLTQIVNLVDTIYNHNIIQGRTYDIKSRN